MPERNPTHLNVQMNSTANRIGKQFDLMALHMDEWFKAMAAVGWDVGQAEVIGFAETTRPVVPLSAAAKDSLVHHIELTMQQYTPEYLADVVQEPVARAYERGMADGNKRLKAATQGKINLQTQALLPMDAEMIQAHNLRITEAFDRIVVNATDGLKTAVTRSFLDQEDIMQTRRRVDKYFHPERHPDLRSVYMKDGSRTMSPRARSMMYIRTTMNEAYNDAAAARYRPFSDWYDWLAAADCCDDCNERENGNPYKWGAGPQPPEHPNCRCTTVIHVKDLTTLDEAGFGEVGLTINLQRNPGAWAHPDLQALTGRVVA